MVDQPKRLAALAIAFSRRHGRAATVVGALVVFTTFVVREAFREHYKDLADSLDSARSGFFRESDMRYAITLLGHLRADLEPVQFNENGESEAARIRADGTRLAEGVVRPITERYDEQRGQLYLLNDVVRKLPSPTRFALRAKEIEASIDSGIAEGNAILDRWYTRPKDSQRVSVGQAREERDALLRATRTLQDRSSVAPSPLDLFRIDVTDEALKLRDQAEQNFITCTRASYFLYALGWVLGLTGRLTGIPVGTNIE